MKSSELSSGQKQCVIEYAKLLLSGVGTMPSAVEQYQFAIHYRKALSDEEISRLPQDWCAIPAVDPGSVGQFKVLETNV